MDTAHWPVQGIGNGKNVGEKRPRPPKEHVMSCPRCSSTNTKFCYYNNYSLSQPRYFCKACRRYWTHGGSLRNVPMGGGSRKNRRPSSSSSSPVPSVKELGSSVGQANLDPVSFAAQNHGMIHVGHDLNLACDPAVRSYSMGVPEYVTFDLQNPGFSSAAAAVHQLPARELLKEGNFMGLSPGYNSSSGGIPGFKQNLGFLCDGFGDLQGVHEDHHHPANCSSRNLFFPFVDHSKQAAANGDPPAFEHEKGETNGFWSGMLAGGSPR